MSELKTPHAGDDKSRDDDVVSLLMRQHGDIRNLFDEVERSKGEERRDAFRRLVRLLAVHETAEEEVVHPFVRRSIEGASRSSRTAWRRRSRPRRPSPRWTTRTPTTRSSCPS